jgi:hypothetical protein
VEMLNTIQKILDEINTLYEQIRENPQQAKAIEIELLNYKVVQLYDHTRKLDEGSLFAMAGDSIESLEAEKPKTKAIAEEKTEIVEKKKAIPEEEEIIETEVTVKTEEVEISLGSSSKEEIIEEVKPAEEIPQKETPVIEPVVEDTETPEQKADIIPEAEPKPTESVKEEAEEPMPEPKKEAEEELPSDFKPDLFSEAQVQIEKKALHQKFVRKEPSVNERIASTKGSGSLGESLQKGKITDIKTAISLNLKLSIIKDLFKGDQKEYKKMIDFLSKCKNYSEAKMYLVNEKENREYWEEKPELFDTLMDLLNRRFRLD